MRNLESTTQIAALPINRVIVRTLRRLASQWPIASLGVLWVAAYIPAALGQADFYIVDNIRLASYAPGSLIRSQPMEGAPHDTAAYRVLYRSTGIRGEPIAVSGVVIIPNGAPPRNGRPIVAWAHPTTGIEDICAPSLAHVFFQSVQGLREMVERGYVVTATDYPGLGTAGTHPFLVGISEGRAVLDSVRVARSMPNAGGGQSFAVWGHSQGGQAALFASIIARSYAPELRLVGVAAAAPATELGTLLAADLDTSGGKNLTAMTLWSWSRVYGAPMTNVVTSAAIPAINQLAGECIERFFDVLIRRGPTRALDRSFLKVNNFADKEPWRSLLARNTPGKLPPGIPIFLAQGTTDDLVRPSVTVNYRQKLCRAGSPVQLYMMQGVGHAFAGRDSASVAVAWMTDRFAGIKPPSNCGDVLSKTSLLAAFSARDEANRRRNC